MTPKEKAEELMYKYVWIAYSLDKYHQKKCALIAVDEIIHYLEITLGVDKEDFEYWYEVKQEIEKL